MQPDERSAATESRERRLYAIGGKPLGWRRFGAVRVGPVMFDWRFVRGTRYLGLWVGPVQVHASLGDHAGTGGTRYGLTVTRWRHGR